MVAVNVVTPVYLKVRNPVSGKEALVEAAQTPAAHNRLFFINSRLFSFITYSILEFHIRKANIRFYDSRKMKFRRFLSFLLQNPSPRLQ